MVGEIDSQNNPGGIRVAPMVLNGVIGVGDGEGMVGGGMGGVRARNLNLQERRGGT